MRALIVEDGLSRGALAAARALALDGWQVGVASPLRGGLAGSSKSVSRRHVVPPLSEGLDAFVDATNAALRAGGYELVFGAGDAELLALSLRRSDLEAVVPHAEHDVVLRALDKLELARAAERAGMATPVTVEATSDAIGSWGRPAIVKSRLHAMPWHDGSTSRIEVGYGAAELQTKQRVEAVVAAGGQPLLQDFVEGRLMAFTAVVGWDGEVVAEVKQHAGAVWPPGEGASVRAETVAVDEDLSAKVRALLTELGWFGLAELQFQVPRGGEPHLVDLNGRFYGSMSLATAAGVNLPAVWARVATGRPVKRGQRARPGVRYHWLEGDLRRARVERHGGAGRDFAGSLRYTRGATHSIWDPADRGPAIWFVRELGRRLVRKKRRR